MTSLESLARIESYLRDLRQKAKAGPRLLPGTGRKVASKGKK